MARKKVVFLSGTRADFGKLKSLIEILHDKEQFEVHIFATGMHMDKKYGFTVLEIEKCGYDNIFKYINYDNEASMDITLSRTIEGFANYIRLIEPDLIVVHGDRIEALAGATVGALNNILVAHIEGGELSGTVDELIRHAVSKLSHAHFVANEEAKIRLCQMGESVESVFVIGSPDMDAMKSNKLPTYNEVVKYYKIPFEKYSIAMFHPVTTEYEMMEKYAEEYVAALVESGKNYIAIYPNNDRGSQFIMSRIKKFEGSDKFKIFPSVRFEYFLVMMKHAAFIVGNSSAGIREAPFYGVPTVNVGTRQNGRSISNKIIHTGYDKSDILKGIQSAEVTSIMPEFDFGEGNSNHLFKEIISKKDFWKTPKQKTFSDVRISR